MNYKEQMSGNKHAVLKLFPKYHNSDKLTIIVLLSVALEELSTEDENLSLVRQMGNSVLEHLRTDWEIEDYANFKNGIAKFNSVTWEYAQEGILRLLTTSEKEIKQEKHLLASYLFQEEPKDPYEALAGVSGRMLSYTTRIAQELYRQNPNIEAICSLLDEMEGQNEVMPVLLKGFEQHFSLLQYFPTYEKCYQNFRKDYISLIKKNLKRLDYQHRANKEKRRESQLNYDLKYYKER